MWRRIIATMPAADGTRYCERLGCGRPIPHTLPCGRRLPDTQCEARRFCSRKCIATTPKGIRSYRVKAVKSKDIVPASFADALEAIILRLDILTAAAATINGNAQASAQRDGALCVARVLACYLGGNIADDREEVRAVLARAAGRRVRNA